MAPTQSPSSITSSSPPLHTFHVHRRAIPYRLFAMIYLFAIIILFYQHLHKLINLVMNSSTSTSRTSSNSIFLHLSMILADVVLAFMWTTTQACRMRPIRRRTFPDNLAKMLEKSGEYPGLDVFICTADPYKEPPMSVVNTALSVMAYEYPTDKISVYVSDDGGSKLTFFAFMEAAKFARYWLPFCREKRLVERSPEAYFSSNHGCSCEDEEMKTLYEIMKGRVENVVERGELNYEYLTTSQLHERDTLSKWKSGFTRQDHPTIIEVLLDSSEDKDITGHKMPNLVYVSREKSRTSHHNFKAGALNVLTRVSATMTNAPVILTLDCDMYSNDPVTPLRALCFLWEPLKGLELAYVQFPQHFSGINENDIYANENKRLFRVNPMGMDGLQGTGYVGTGCFFHRRALFGSPSSPRFVVERRELDPEHVVGEDVKSEIVLSKAHLVATCNYEDGTNWGSKIGFRYGSLVEDYYTGYKLQCEGWKSVFCDPERPAFLGDIPINLHDVLSQNKRWAIGLLQVAFSKYCTLTYGIKSMGLLMGLAYSHYAFWPFWSIPITIYAFLPPLAFINGVSTLPKVMDPLFCLYVFFFVGAYAQDLIDFLLTNGTIMRWWSEQRMWLIRGLTSYLFGYIDFFLQKLGISASGFNVTNKVIDDEQSKRYEQGAFEFGITSPFFVVLTMAAIVNLIAFVVGVIRVVFFPEKFGEVFVQMLISGFVMVNCWPIYEGIALRVDKGRMPTKTTTMAILLVGFLYCATSITLKS
ncbi:hypothetical protein Syun_019678 [Stephania yunnanensis]|uniref:Cellulose synthase-like protein G3 n=1 Tax=Stephania yunnanensis TaxID=152371 RepID=A0AAP0IUJ5_9MAGN